MKSRITLLFIIYLVCAGRLLAQIAIAEAKAKPFGSVVSVSGIITSGEEFGALRFLQDSTGGIAAFPNSASENAMRQLKPGDRVRLSGALALYRGAIEISPVLAVVLESSGNPLPDPVSTTVAGLKADSVQGMMVSVTCARFERQGGTFTEGKRRLYDMTGHEIETVLDNEHPFIGKEVVSGAFHAVGIAHFEYNPRFMIPAVPGLTPTDCLLSYPHIPKDFDQGGGRFTWRGSSEARGVVRYGPEMGSAVTITLEDTSLWHEVDVSSLAPSTFFYVQTGNVMNGDTSWSPKRSYITNSESSGNTDVYFNNSVDIHSGSVPAGTSFAEMMDAIFELIASADSTIDVAMYNVNRDDIVNALEVAHVNGVRVRYIADADQSNHALDPAPDFPVLFRDGPGIMHNKFIVVDPHDPVNATVWTGATNFTTNQLARDPNNAISIRDQSLARIYLREFEEMWGGSGALPVPALARQGEAKRDDTPHFLEISDKPVEVYFSPSDYTADAIARFIGESEESLELGLLLFTHEELADSLVWAASAGVEVRGIYNDPEFSGSVLQILAAGGVDMQDYRPSTIFHHKYAIADAETGSGAILTGSHNWTYSADNINDENTLILHDPALAALYRGEFSARWNETVVSTLYPLDAGVEVGPNPFGDHLLVYSDRPVMLMTLRDIAGRMIVTTTDTELDTSNLPQGIYCLSVLTADGTSYVFKVIRTGP